MPLILAHELLNTTMVLQSVWGFLAFGCCASAFYVVNDLVDLPSDRAHPSKKNRPFASGALQVSHGVILIISLLTLAVFLASLLPRSFLYALIIYSILTLAYSIQIKKIPILDIIVLASFYAIRLVAGGLATVVTVSPWLLAFSMFMFLSLACVKRYSEMLLMREQKNGDSPKGRGYVLGDAEIVSQLGTASGFISVLVLALYVNSDEITSLYHNPERLWFLCPVVLYWISRVWLLAHRNMLHEDPIVFAIYDKVSYISGLACGLVLYLATN